MWPKVRIRKNRRGIWVQLSYPPTGIGTRARTYSTLIQPREALQLAVRLIWAATPAGKEGKGDPES